MRRIFASNLKMLRRERGISQKQLADAVGVSQQCVSEWENARIEPTLSSLWRIADFFDLSLDFLCGRRDW